MSWKFEGNNGNNYADLFRSKGLGTHIITNNPASDIVLPRSNQMAGHPGIPYGLISSAYLEIVRKVGFVFVTNGSGFGFHTESSSAFYTLEEKVFDSIEECVYIGCR